MSAQQINPLSAASLFSVEGWVAVVTGGGTGVGLMITKALVANGARVYITGRRADVLETSARVHGGGGEADSSSSSIVPLQMDVEDKDSIRRVVAEVEKREGRLEILVNNAGSWQGRVEAKPEDGVEAYSEAMFGEDMQGCWQKSFLTNATSPYYVTAAFLPLLAKAATAGPTGRAGTVVNNASMAGLLRASLNRQYAYNVSKAAAIHLTRQMALEFSTKGIDVRVNGLAIGYFPSEMTAGPSDERNENGAFDDVFCQMAAQQGVYVRRLGKAEDIARLVLTLATNDYMWGTVTLLDGGYSLRLGGGL